MCNYWANFIRSGDPNGPDADGADMPFWKPFTDNDPCRIMFCDEVYISNKEPDPLMRFLVGQYLKKH
jgi:para-nitrobenzyl esterase